MQLPLPIPVTIVRCVVGKVRRISAGSAHRINLKITVPIRGEHNFRTARRPIRRVVVAAVHGDVGLARSGFAHHINLIVAVAVAHEGDFAAIG